MAHFLFSVKICPNMLFKVNEVSQLFHTRNNFDTAGNTLQDPISTEQPYALRDQYIIQKYSQSSQSFWAVSVLSRSS